MQKSVGNHSGENRRKGKMSTWPEGTRETQERGGK